MKRAVGTLALLIVLPLTLVAVAPTQAATKISSCPVTISAPGVYQVTQDLTYSGPDTAITILASNVDLHLGNHTLTGSGGAVWGVVVQSAANVSIHNGTVQGFVVGIHLQGTVDNKVANLTSIQNGYSGIAVRVGSTGATVTNCTANQNGFLGIQLGTGSSGNTLTRNTVNGNGVYGFYIVNGASFNTVTNNTANGNQVGIGLTLDPTTGNLIQGNTTSLNFVGISVDAGHTGNTLQGNTALTNRDYDLADWNGNCAANAWSNNTFVTDLAAGVPDGGPGTGCIR
jgi:parallel beta-helix repeat protein